MIVATPVPVPVIMPDVAPTLTIEVLLLVQLPPVGVLLSVPVPPTHIEEGPVRVEGALFTTTVRVVMQPEVSM